MYAEIPSIPQITYKSAAQNVDIGSIVLLVVNTPPLGLMSGCLKAVLSIIAGILSLAGCLKLESCFTQKGEQVPSFYCDLLVTHLSP